MEPEFNLGSVFYKQETPSELEWTDYWIFQTLTKTNCLIADSERIRFHRNRLFIEVNDNSFPVFYKQQTPTELRRYITPAIHNVLTLCKNL
jgi:hypothetical protein